MRSDLRRDAWDVARTALTWELPAERWAIVVPLLDELAAALDADDEDGVAQAIMDLEQAGPVRGPRSMVGSSAPGEVRERIRVLERISQLPREDAEPSLKGRGDDATSSDASR